MAKPYKVHRPDDRHDVEGPVDGRWRRGELRAWTQREDETRTLDVQYRPAGSSSRAIDPVTVEQVREDTSAAWAVPSRTARDRCRCHGPLADPELDHLKLAAHYVNPYQWCEVVVSRLRKSDRRGDGLVLASQRRAFAAPAIAHQAPPFT
jgi:hypothetical protein